MPNDDDGIATPFQSNKMKKKHFQPYSQLSLKNARLQKSEREIDYFIYRNENVEIYKKKPK